MPALGRGNHFPALQPRDAGICPPPKNEIHFRHVAAKSVYRIFGITAGYLMLILVSSYYLYWNGTTMTEPVGLLFGNFSFALLCNGFYEKKRFLVYSGIFFLAIGLSARSGAMFVLPFLILGIAFLFKEKNPCLYISTYNK